MFVEKQSTKILSSVGVICKNGLNTYLFTCRSYGASDFLLVLDYKHSTPTGSKTSYFLCFTKKPTLENL
jgi:hypothetical protein